MTSYDDETGPSVSQSLGSESQRAEYEFIKTYQKLPLLWDMKHSDYSNKYKRNAALDKLLVILKKLNHLATRYNVRQKINILRSCYRKELRKHLASKVIGSDGEETFEYVPSSWKFHKLRFLDCNEKSDTSVNNSNIVEVNIEEHNYEEQRSNNTSDDSLSGQEEDTQHNIMDSLPKYQSSTYIQTHRKPRKRIKLENGHNYLEINNEKDELMDREFDAIGANVACKLKRMSQFQRYHAELLINKVLIKGLKNTLTDDTDLTDVWNVS